MASTSSMSKTDWVYDVFLSFGEDTGDTFTGFLCCNLRKKGIITVMEEEETRQGEQIAPAVLDAIKGSRIVIVVLSQKYILSSRCMDELARIVECSELMGQTIIPVFYKVQPLKLQERKGEQGRAMEALEERFRDDMEKVKEWKDAFLKVSSIFGWKFEGGYEWKIIERISQDVSRRLGRPPLLHVAEPTTRMDPLLNKLKSLLCDGSLETSVIGLYGIDQIAKTTIAKLCYNSLSESFEGSTFLENVSATSKQCNGLAELQETLLTEILGNNDNLKVASVARGINLIRERLRNKRVLIVLDDVDHLDQLEALDSSHDWFGSGSRIIITTRDEHLLVAHGVEHIYKINELFDDDAALEQLGYAHQEICEMCKAHFNALGHHEKAIFLDIACFFSQENKDHVVKMLRNCNLYPDIGIPILISMSLINIKGNKLQINDSLRHMGRDIVRQESPDPRSCSRLWFHEDVLQVLEENSGTDAIEGILVDLLRAKRILNAKAFKKMRRLRLLIVKNACFSSGPEYLPNELRWLEWSNYPSPSLPSGFRAKKLTVLKLHSGSITRLWDGFQMLNLATVELIKCESLREIPNVSSVPNLEKLIVNNCTSLISVHGSVGFLEKLTVLNFQGCPNLKRVPQNFRLISLKDLVLSGCRNLTKFPDILASMEQVESVDLSDTAFKDLPSSIENLIGLRSLKLSSCRNLKALPSNIYSLSKIKNLDLKGCTSLRKLPANTSSLINSKIGFLMLESLDASDCGIGNLDFLGTLNCFARLEYLDLSRNDFVILPSCICKFSELKFLHLEDCKQLREMPELPVNLTYVNAKGCKSLERLHSWSLPSNTKFKVNFSNCQRLSQAQVAKKLLNETSFRDNEFQVMIPGSNIPDGLSYQSSGNSMSFKVQSCVGKNLVGLIVSTVFCLKHKGLVVLKCNISVNGKTIVSLVSDLYDSVHLEHLWLGYFPLTRSLERIWDGWNQVEISFRFLEVDGKESATVKLKGSGVHFLGKQNGKEVNGSDDIRVLFPENCKFLKGRAADTSFEPIEDETPDDHKFHIHELDHNFMLNRCKENRDAVAVKRHCGLAKHSISISCNLLLEKGKKNWPIALGPKLIPFKVTMRRKRQREKTEGTRRKRKSAKH